MAMHPENRNWRSLADQATKETNPEKLVALAEQFWLALDDREKSDWGYSHHTVHRASLRRIRYSALLQTAVKSFNFRHALQISVRTTRALKNFMPSILLCPWGSQREDV